MRPWLCREQTKQGHPGSLSGASMLSGTPPALTVFQAASLREALSLRVVASPPFLLKPLPSLVWILRPSLKHSPPQSVPSGSLGATSSPSFLGHTSTAVLQGDIILIALQ